MRLLKYVLLGILQGFTEPLPISSSGHLKVVRAIFNDNVLQDFNFEIVVNFGSLIAILFLYRKEILEIITHFFKYLKTKNKKYRANYNYAWMIVIGTIPAGIVGLLLKDTIEKYFSLKVLGLMFIVTSLLLYICKDRRGNKTKETMTWKDALMVGLFQVIALIPGISRSGATVFGATQVDLDKETTINYSFMLYIPISIATMILGITDIIKAGNLVDLIVPYSFSLFASAIVTYYAAKLFINAFKNNKLIYFSIYCFILGIIVFMAF